MKKAVCLLSVIVLLTLTCVPALAISIRGVNPGMTLYVKTTGGTLNVRETPNPKAAVHYKLPNHTPVVAYDNYSDGFLLVEFKVNGKFATGYVSLDYLSAEKPSKVNNNGAIVVGGSTAKPEPKTETLVSKLDFASFKLIDPNWMLIIAAKPSRPGGFVNFRWAPCTDAALIQKMYKGMEMKVIAEGKKWYQVQNEEGYIGFISKEFTEVVYYGPVPVDDGDGVGAAAK